MFNCVRKEDIDYSPYDEGEWRLVFQIDLSQHKSLVTSCLNL
jgi:hypothetical protein